MNFEIKFNEPGTYLIQLYTTDKNRVINQPFYVGGYPLNPHYSDYYDYINSFGDLDLKQIE